MAAAEQLQAQAAAIIEPLITAGPKGVKTMVASEIDKIVAQYAMHSQAKLENKEFDRRKKEMEKILNQILEISSEVETTQSEILKNLSKPPISGNIRATMDFWITMKVYPKVLEKLEYGNLDMGKKETFAPFLDQVKEKLKEETLTSIIWRRLTNLGADDIYRTIEKLVAERAADYSIEEKEYQESMKQWSKINAKKKTIPSLVQKFNVIPKYDYEKAVKDKLLADFLENTRRGLNLEQYFRQGNE